jgi:hypothetical protein
LANETGSWFPESINVPDMEPFCANAGNVSNNVEISRKYIFRIILFFLLRISAQR